MAVAPALGDLGDGQLFRALHAGRFDLTIDLQGLLRSALMTAATGARGRVEWPTRRRVRRWFYTDVVDAPRLGLHAVKRVQRMIDALGADAAQPRFKIPIAAADRLWARKTVVEVPSPRIILNVGARWPTKRWPPEHFAEIGRRARDEFGAGLIAVGAAGDRPLVDALTRRLESGSVLDVCGRTSLMQLAALASEADLLISNDTGPLHLAAASGARVLGVFTCTSPAAYRSVWPARGHGSELRVVRLQLSQEVRPAGLHVRAHSRACLADRPGSDRGRDHEPRQRLRTGLIAAATVYHGARPFFRARVAAVVSVSEEPSHTAEVSVSWTDMLSAVLANDLGRHKLPQELR